MMSATYFGEITELGSRAVWYSDEEDDDDEEDDESSSGIRRKSPPFPVAEPSDHDAIRANITLTFKRVPAHQQIKFTTCLISLASQIQYKHFKLNDSTLLGYFDSFGKAYAYPIQRGQQEIGKTDEEYVLWLLFDSTHQYISGHEVGYFVEALREKLHSEFNLTHSNRIIVISNQYSKSEHLEYLSNITNPSAAGMKLEQPFIGRPLSPPSLIKNQFESALFEQLTLSMWPTFVVCLPNPVEFWFDATKNWPTVPKQIIDHKLHDDSLKRTFIYQ